MKLNKQNKNTVVTFLVASYVAGHAIGVAQMSKKKSDLLPVLITSFLAGNLGMRAYLGIKAQKKAEQNAA